MTKASYRFNIIYASIHGVLLSIYDGCVEFDNLVGMI